MFLRLSIKASGKMQDILIDTSLRPWVLMRNAQVGDGDFLIQHKVRCII